MYQVKDAMSREVVAIQPNATVEEAIRTLLEYSISGAPVIDDDGQLRGIISQFQLLEVLYDPQVRRRRVKEFMTRDVFTIDEGALLGTAANMFVVHRIRRIPVLRNGAVVGVISRSDLLRYFAKTGEEIDVFFSRLQESHAEAAV